VRLLLDTHVAVWAVNRPARLAPAIRRLIANPGNGIWVSAVSIWEIAIKQKLERRDAPPITAAQAIQHFVDSGYTLLPVTEHHAAAVASLPLLHGDPFDRLLVAQALYEPMRLVTHDERLAGYSETIITG
jgi:PIN domain nuclease of toxin-antitoxin system